MKLLKRFFLGISAVTAIFFFIGLFLSPIYRVERSILINAPIEVVFDYVNDLKKNELWSPWKRNDPSMQIKYGEKIKGEGASYSWTSKNSGAGRLIITESEADKLIRTKMLFKGKSRGQGYWKFSQRDNQVYVLQGFEGDVGGNIIARYFGLFMDSLLGKNFEQGMSQLKELCEKKS